MYPNNQNNSFYSSVPAGQPSGTSSRRKVLLIIGAALMIATLLVAVIFGISSRQGASADGSKLISLIQAGDSVSSYELLSSDGKLAIPETDWAGFIALNQPILVDKKVSKAYGDKPDELVIEEGFDVGEPGSVVRVTILSDANTKLIHTVSINDTDL
jgi:hypothetical protein